MTISVLAATRSSGNLPSCGTQARAAAYRGSRVRATLAQSVAIISRVHIESSAPTRIDLAGGTLDIWPLYLFHERAQTLNAAISLRARCSIRPRSDARPDDRLRRHRAARRSRALARAARQPRAAAARPAAALFSGRGARAADALRVAGRRRHRRIVGAEHRGLRRAGGLERAARRSDAEILQIAMNVEAQAIDVPTGVQDYRPALYGGISAVELGVDGVRRVALPSSRPSCEQRLVLAYTNASRNSGINNWEVTKRHIDGDREVQRRFARIRDIAGAMRERARAQATGPRSAGRSPTNGRTARASRPA